MRFLLNIVCWSFVCLRFYQVFASSCGYCVGGCNEALGLCLVKCQGGWIGLGCHKRCIIKIHCINPCKCNPACACDVQFMKCNTTLCVNDDALPQSSGIKDASKIVPYASLAALGLCITLTSVFCCISRQRNKRARSGRLRGHIMSMACWSLCSQRRDWLLKKGFKWGLPGFQLGAKDSLDTIAGDDEFLAQEQSQAFRHWRRSNAPVLGVKAERPMVISSTSGYRWKRKWRDRKVASKQKQKMRHEKRKLRKMGMSPKQRGSIILPATSIMPRVPSFVKGGSRRGSKLPFSRQGSSQGSGAVTSVPFSASQPGSQTSSVHSRASEASKSSTRQHHQPHHPPPAPVLTVFNPSASPASDASQNTAAFHEKNVNSQPTAGASVVVQSASKTTSPSDSSKNVNLHHTAGASVVVHLASKTTSSSPSSASPLTSSQSSPSLPNHVNKPSVHEKPVVKTVAETTNSSSLPSTVIQVNQSNIQESASPGTSPEGSQPPEPADGELVDGTAVNITMQPGTSLQSATVQVLPRVVEKHHADQSSTPLLKGSSNATKAVRRGSTGNNSPPSARCSSGKPAVSGKKSATSNELPNKLHPNPKAKQRAEKSRSNREATSVDSVSLSSETPLTDLVYFIWESPPK